MNPCHPQNFQCHLKVNQHDEVEVINTSLRSGRDDNDSKEVSNEEDDVYAEQREHIKMYMNSYYDSGSDDDQICSESEDEIIEDMEQIAAEMKNDVELNKTVEDKESNP